jgi:hypothetical protein
MDIDPYSKIMGIKDNKNVFQRLIETDVFEIASREAFPDIYYLSKFGSLKDDLYLCVPIEIFDPQNILGNITHYFFSELGNFMDYARHMYGVNMDNVEHLIECTNAIIN